MRIDAKDFVREVVLKNYKESKDDQKSFQKLWNAVVSMNSVAEYVALQRLGYKMSLQGYEIDRESKNVRDTYVELQLIRDRADTLKHIRRHFRRGPLIETSTAVDVSDPTTFELNDGSTLHSLRDCLDRAFAMLSTIPELQ